MRISFVIVFLLLFSCATIVRKDPQPQRIFVKDMVSKKGIADVKVRINGKDIGVTDKEGLIVFLTEQKNEADDYLLELTNDQYNPIKVRIKNKIGGGYIAGDISLFLLGLIPGIVSLVVDAVSGEWYSYQDKIIIQMQAK